MEIYFYSYTSFIAIFIATIMGSSMVFFLKRNLSNKTSSIIFGLTSGVMLSASIFGLIIPSMENSYRFKAFPVLIGIFLGALFLYILDKILSKSHQNKTHIKFFIAVTFHNIPEGLAIGISYSLALFYNDPAYLFSALSLTLGIALQNIPESLATSLTLYESGLSKKKSFFYGSLSGLVEPLFALLGFYISIRINFLLPWLLAFAGGSMLYITIDEITPYIKKEEQSSLGSWFFIIGFCLMIILESI